MAGHNVTISPSARRYADAAFAVARDAGELDAWQQSLDRVAALLEHAQARRVLTSPIVRPEEKRAALDRLAPAGTRLAANFLHILVERDRLGLIPGIAEAFREEVNVERGIVTADVTTAVPLDAETERVIAQRLGAYLGHAPERLSIRARVDPDLIGGVVAQIGDTRIDDSVRGRIDRLHRTLIRAR